MRFTTLALASAAGGLLLAGTAAAGPLGGAIGGGAGGALGGSVGGAIGGVGGSLGGAVSGTGGAAANHSVGAIGGVGGGIGGGVGGGLGHTMGNSHIDTSTAGSLGGGLGHSLNTTGRIDDGTGASLGRDVDASAGGSASAANAASLPGLARGQTVTDASGQVLGTVDGVERTRNGTVTGVLMTTAGGGHRLLRLAPETLHVARGVVTTSQSMGALAVNRSADRARASAEGGQYKAAGAGAVARSDATATYASANRVGDLARSDAKATYASAGRLGDLARSDARATYASAGRLGDLARSDARATYATAGRAGNLAALTAGMTVRTARGTTLGTVSRVVRSADGTVRTVLVRTASGERRIVKLAPRSLSLSGDVVTTSQTTLSAHG